MTTTACVPRRTIRRKSLSESKMRSFSAARVHTHSAVHRGSWFLASLTFLLLLPPIVAADLPVDVLFKGGTIVDGSGNPGVVGDVAILGERIVAVGEFTPTAIGRTIDCTGLIIAPGCIDLHTHSDKQVVDPLLRGSVNYLMQGCTTQVTGNCGSGPIDVAELYRAVETEGAGTNVAHLIPQGNLREAVIGSVDRPATEDEIRQMQSLAETGMQAGAWGMSTGLIYVPSVYATTAEIAAIAKVIGTHGGIYASHIRGEGSDLLAAIDEALQIGAESRAAVHISHLKSSGMENWGKLRLAIARIEQAREQGVLVTADQYPYTASSTSLEAIVIPTWARSGGDKALLKRLDDAIDGPRLRAEITSSLQTKREGAAIVIARHAHNAAYVGKNIAEVAVMEQITPTDAVIQIVRHGGAAVVHFSMDEEDVRQAMQRPWVATASDGRSYLPGSDRPHPRSYGTFARKIGRYALKDGVITLEQAVRSSTGLPAEILHLPERGLLKGGYFADVMVFDPRTYIDAATFDDPHRYAVGMQYVFVNGVPAIHQGTPTGSLAGRALRHVSTKTP
jgi:N-acyl-D-amino-acid deacylase